MQSRIESLSTKLLVGMHARMSMANNTTGELWGQFMPRTGEIENRLGVCFYSLQRFNGVQNYENFTPQIQFEKWAAVEVSSAEPLPHGMASLQLPAGKYAVFLHRGPASSAPATFRYIFGEWNPASEFEVDDRPHFEILQPAYRPDDPEAEEEVWIPIK